VIEALAFDRDPPEFGEQDDLTLPDNEGMKAAALPEIIAFRVRPVLGASSKARIFLDHDVNLHPPCAI